MAKHVSAGRQVLSGLTGALTAAVGALILGEYAFTGATPYIAGLLFGLVVAEVVLTVNRVATAAVAVASGLESGLGILWAAWISTSEGVSPMPAAAWVAVVMSAALGAVWVVIPSRRRIPAPSRPDR